MFTVEAAEVSELEAALERVLGRYLEAELLSKETANAILQDPSQLLEALDATFPVGAVPPQLLHEGGDGDSAAVTLGGDRSADVEPAHHGATEGRADGVGVLGQDQLGHLRAGAVHRVGRQIGHGRGIAP